MISLLVAMGNNNVIGRNNTMPWHLPRDLQYFKELTTGKTVVMGRKTLESIGKPLPNRRNIVLSRTKSAIEGVEVIHELEEIFKIANENPEEELFIIGGGNIYNQAINFADRLYITHIEEDFVGDTTFPNFSTEDWELVSKTAGTKNEANPYYFYFAVYDRK